MKIISKFKDFYDHKVAKYGIDPVLVFDRRHPSDAEILHSLPKPPAEWEEEYGACAVVSELYIGLPQTKKSIRLTISDKFQVKKASISPFRQSVFKTARSMPCRNTAITTGFGITKSKMSIFKRPAVTGMA